MQTFIWNYFRLLCTVIDVMIPNKQITCSESTIEILEKCVKYVQSYYKDNRNKT